MTRRIVFFEDEKACNFSPIALLRPVFELLCGHFSTRERIQSQFPDSDWGVLIRPFLAEVYKDQHPRCRVNDLEWVRQQSAIHINGRWIFDAASVHQIEANTAGWIDGELVWVCIEPGELSANFPGEFEEEIQQISRTKKPCEASGAMLQYPWDLINLNSAQLEKDFQSRSKSNSTSITEEASVVGPVDQLFIAATAEIDPFVVFDTRHGSVWIDEGAKIQAFTRIEGPAYVGPQTQTFRANLREGTSIGPMCRVGGEIEESIIHGFANKYHDGFLGHSYVCPWVNLGALSSSSDLKNDYSDVSVPLVGKRIKTGSNKVGCFIGDHTKTALCSLFNTGSSIGVMSLILPGGELIPKHVPSFSRIWHGKLEALPDGTESALETARYAMGRRNQEFTPAMQRLIQNVFEITKDERERALAR